MFLVVGIPEAQRYQGMWPAVHVHSHCHVNWKRGRRLGESGVAGAAGAACGDWARRPRNVSKGTWNNLCPRERRQGTRGRSAQGMQLRGGQHGMRRRSTQLHYPSVAVQDGATKHMPIDLTICPMSIRRRKNKKKSASDGWQSYRARQDS